MRSSDVARKVDREAESQNTTSGPRRRLQTAPNPQPNPAFYSEDILPLTEEEAGDGRWVRFLTLVHDQGGHYRPRCSAPAAYGGFSDVWQCDTRFADGSKVVVSPKSVISGSSIDIIYHLPGGRQKAPGRQSPTGIKQVSNEEKNAGGKSKFQSPVLLIINTPLLQRLKGELRVWMRLQHPNVAPLIGFNFDGEIALISPWFSYGNISIYIRDHPEADKWRLVGVFAFRITVNFHCL